VCQEFLDTSLPQGFADGGGFDELGAGAKDGEDFCNGFHQFSQID